ncbi:hypothetical protein [Rhodohalobacter sp. SW132]|nr:hypothetical protein [Rhodohalobacter sp. SW132]
MPHSDAASPILAQIVNSSIGKLIPVTQKGDRGSESAMTLGGFQGLASQ